MLAKSNHSDQFSSKLVFSRGEWITIGICAVSIIALGVTGYANLRPDASLSDLLYQTIGLFTFGFSVPGGVIPWQLDAARWLAPMLLSYAAFKTVLLILRGHLLLLRIRCLKHHAVVCGLGEHGWPIIQSLSAKRIPTAVIEADVLNSHLGWAERTGLYVLPDNALDTSNIANINLTQAQYLLAVTRDDTANIEWVVQAYQLKQADPKPPLLTCIAHVQSHELAAAFYDDAVFSQDFAYFSARIINRQQLAARWLLLRHGPNASLGGNLASMYQINLLLLGNDPFFEDLIVRLAKLGHYGTPQPICLLLAGPQAESGLARLHKRYPALSSIIDCRAEDMELGFLNAHTAQHLIDDFHPDMIIVCATGTESTLIWCKALARLELHCPVTVCQFSGDLLARRIESLLAANTHFKFVYPADEIFDINNLFNATHDQLAIGIHHHYVESQIAAGDTPEKNPSMMLWSELPETLKDANRNQADHLQIKCSILTGNVFPTPEQFVQHLNAATLERLARMEHDRWMAEKLLDGWRYTDGKKDTAARLSPSLVAWEQLPESERNKDREAVRNIPQLLQWLAAQDKQSKSIPYLG